MTTPAVLLATAAVALSACAAPTHLDAAPAEAMPPGSVQARIGLSAPGAAAFFAERPPAARFRAALAPPAAHRSQCAAPDAMPNVAPADSLAPRGAIRSVPLGGAMPMPLPNLCDSPAVRVARR